MQRERAEEKIAASIRRWAGDWRATEHGLTRSAATQRVLRDPWAAAHAAPHQKLPNPFLGRRWHASSWLMMRADYGAA